MYNLEDMMKNISLDNSTDYVEYFKNNPELYKQLKDEISKNVMNKICEDLSAIQPINPFWN